MSTSPDPGYVRGLEAAARWAAAFDQDIPGLDRDTCRQLAKGLAAMAESARTRADQHITIEESA